MDVSHGYYTRRAGVRTENPSGSQSSPVNTGKGKGAKGRKSSRDSVNTPNKPTSEKSSKSRTPSGQILSTSVKHIRNFFQYSPAASQVENSPNCKLAMHDNVGKTNIQQLLKLFAAGEEAKQLITQSKGKGIIPKMFKVTEHNEEENNNAGRDVPIALEKEMSNKAVLLSSTKTNASQELSIADQRITEHNGPVDNSEQVLINGEEVTTKQTGPAAENPINEETEEINDLVQKLLADNMDAQFRFLVEFIGKMQSSIQGSHEKLKNELTANLAEMMESKNCEAQKDIEDIQRGHQQLINEVSVLRAENRIIKGVIENQFQLLQECNERVTRLETQTKQDMISISNLDEVQGENSTVLVISFFEHVLGIQVAIKNAYRTGTRNPKQITVILQDKNQKGMIFKNVSKLKNFRTKSGNKVFIDNVLPMAEAEKRRKQREIVTKNRQLPKAQQRNMKIIRGNLKIEHQEVVQPVKVPPPGNILDMSPEEMEDTLNIELEGSDLVASKNSSFLGFVTKALTH